MGMISEFKDFIAKGNAMDLAVGVIIGASFGAIVNSLVSDVITPALLNPALKAAQVEDLAGLKTDGGILYGKFLAAVISFLVIAFVIFLLVKAITKKLITAAKNLPYKIPPSVFNPAKSSTCAAFNAGFSKAGVITSETKEFTIAPNEAPIITPTAKSIALPFAIKSLNSEIIPIVFNFKS